MTRRFSRVAPNRRHSSTVKHALTSTNATTGCSNCESLPFALAGGVTIGGASASEVRGGQQDGLTGRTGEHTADLVARRIWSHGGSGRSPLP